MKILVLAKSPVAGRVKTRLCPPCTPQTAALIAEAALHDTLLAATAVRGARTILLLDGPADARLCRGVEVMRQRGYGLAERIAAAFADAGAPAVLIGMDTPQVSPALLTEAIEHLRRPGFDAVLGSAADGGWWLAGLRRADPRVFLGVPMSTSHTFVAQRRRMLGLGLRVVEVHRLRDVDTITDAIHVAKEVPHSRFARAVAEALKESAPVTTSYGPRSPSRARTPRSAREADAPSPA